MSEAMTPEQARALQHAPWSYHEWAAERINLVAVSDEEEVCPWCDGAGCEVCGYTGFVYTQRAIKAQAALRGEDG